MTTLRGVMDKTITLEGEMDSTVTLRGLMDKTVTLEGLAPGFTPATPVWLPILPMMIRLAAGD